MSYEPRAWSMSHPNYTPIDITPPELREDGPAPSWIVDVQTDPCQIQDWPHRQATALVPFEVIEGHPRNPNGRTGRIGRELARWGENRAVDPIIVASSPIGPQILLIRREDTNDWAFPGGMVDPGETAGDATIREALEETGVDLTHAAYNLLGRRVVDDPRDTDESWIVTTPTMFFLHEPVEAQAGDDATEARWWPFTDALALSRAVESTGATLYKPHMPLLMVAITYLFP